MPTHTQNKEGVTGKKVVGVSEAEANEAAIWLKLLAEDPETSLGLKSEATDLYRMIGLNIAKAGAREDLMRRATSLANRA